MNRFARMIGLIITAFYMLTWATLSLANAAYTITRDESKGDIKRTVEVILPERVDQPTLEALAKEIKAASPNSYQRTFIGWRIKGEEVGAYWAKTDFLPDLTVTFLGSTAEQYAKLKSSNSTPEGDVFGSWFSTWGFDYKMVGYRKAGKTFIRSTFADGSSATKEYVTNKLSGRSVLVDAEGSDFGEYFFVNTQGDLEFWGENGKFYTAKKTL